MGELSLKQRLALELHRQLFQEAKKEHPLRTLFWESTLRCNARCLHCGSDCKTSSTIKDMPFEDFRKVLVRIREKYDSHKIMVIISGGEPLVRPDIVRCAREIYNLEFPWGMVSNGIGMTPKMIDSLLGAGAHSITISLDGFEEDHNWLRGVQAFRGASGAVKILAQQPDIRFDVVTCVNNRNYNSLPGLRDYLADLGVRQWRLFTIFPTGRAASNPDLQLPPERFRGLMDFIEKTRQGGLIKASYGCEGFLGRYEGRVRDSLFGCNAGVSVASVLIDGSISACGSIRSDYHQGNIYKDDFIDVWENRFGPYRDRSWMKKDQCASCRWFRYCEGGGMHLRDDSGKLIMCHLDRIGR